MAVVADGKSYGIQEGLLFSFPVRIANGKWSIVQGLNIDTFTQEKLDITAKELMEERDAALEECKD